MLLTQRYSCLTNVDALRLFLIAARPFCGMSCRAMALSALGQKEEALSQAREALELDPSQQLAHKVSNTLSGQA
jgi:hypothetical protein